MKDRIQEPVSGYFTKRITDKSQTEIVNFSSISTGYINSIPGEDYNFNYFIRSIKCSYFIPSVAEKPFREYELTDTTDKKRSKDIEFARLYNDKTFDSYSRPYAIKLIISIERNNETEVLSEVLLYNSSIRLNLPLDQYLGSQVVDRDCKILARVSSINNRGTQDEIIISGSFTGNINYTFDSGTMVNQHYYP